MSETTGGDQPPQAARSESDSALTAPSTGPSNLPAEKSDGERKAMLAQAVANEVRNGWHVQSQTDFQAVMRKGKQTSHVLHLILSIITLGLWLIVWVVVWYLNRDQSMVISVDPYGNVNIQK